jgi:hypothetical protein
MGEFPNKATQFKKGQSGNPKGYPGGKRNLKTIVREVFDTVVVRKCEYTGDEDEKPIVDHLMDILVSKAFIDKDAKSIDMLFDRLEGKPTQTIEDQTSDAYKDLVKRLEEEKKKKK